MGRNYLADYNLIAVSANQAETALNTEQDLDTGLLVAKSTIISLEARREDNKDELTGKEEPDMVYDLGTLSNCTLEFAKAQAQHFAFAYAYGLGVCAPSAYGTGYKNLITPAADINLPSFTAAQQFGKTIFKRRFFSMFADTVKSTFAKDSWAKCSIGVKGTGKFTDNVLKETVEAEYNATTLTLANAVQGLDAAERLDNIHQVRVLVPSTGEMKEVACSAVSGATPAEITIVAPGGIATLTDFEILYVPEEPAWCDFPARVSEPPLRVTDLALTLGGKWNGAAFLGGRTLSDEIESIEHSLNNQYMIEYRVGGSGSFANYAFRQGRQQTLNMNRQARDFILQQRIKDNEYFGVRMTATGAEFETDKNYGVDLVFPRCAVLKAPLSVNGKILAEAGDLQVLEDDTYGSVRIEVTNKVNGYAQ